MAIEFEIEEQFSKDLAKLSNFILESKIKKILLSLDSFENLSELSNMKKLKGFKTFFRIRIGNYRLGLSFTKKKLIFVRILHRKHFYNKFP